nr:hypothetical protein [Tanacetum cinerariifolium]
MSTLNFAKVHNMIAFLSKPAKSVGFEQIINFLNAHPIKYALTVNLTIYTSCAEQFWAAVKVKNINGEAQLHAKVDGKKVVISEASIRRELYAKTIAWNKFSNIIASAVICLATDQKFNFSKYIFDSMRVGKGFSRRDTPLFPTMMVQAQKKLGEDIAILTETHPTPIITQPSSSQPSRKQKPRKTKRHDTELPQTSVPTETVADKAVNEEMYNSLERATTIATGLDAEQDKGNISKTQSKAAPNEPSSPGTSSGVGPRRQDTLRDTIAQTRSENVSNSSNDPPLLRVNTLGSREDRLKLKELMEHYTKLSDRVLNLETTKTAQAKEIANLKKRVKRLERKRKSRSHGLKRLYNVGLSARVESTADEESLVNAASIATSVTVAAITTVSFDELTLAQALVEIKNSKPNAKGIVMQEPKPEMPLKKKAQISLDEEFAFKLQAKEDEQERIIKEKAQHIKEVNLAWDDVQAKIEADYEMAQRLQAEEAEEKRNKPPTKAQQRSLISTYLKNIDGWKTRALKNKSFAEIKELFDKAMERINNFVDFRTELVKESTKKDKADIAQESSSKRAGDELDQERSKKQKIEDENESAELKRCLEIVPNDEDEVTIDATLLSSKSPTIIVEIVLWYLDSGCSKHMTRHRDKLINFVSKFIGTGQFGNDHFAAIMGYGDLKMGNILISLVYYVEGLGVDLLLGSRGSNLYTISMADMIKSSPICLLSKASMTKSWLWHHRLSQLNSNTINQLAKQGLVKGLPKLRYTKYHLCSACQWEKAKRNPHPHKPEPSTNEKLKMLHMDLCGPMRVESINKKRYILVIVDDYSCFTWAKFLRTKDEAPKIIIKFLKQAQVSIKATVRYLRINNGTEFINQTLWNYTEEAKITNHTSTARTP